MRTEAVHSSRSVGAVGLAIHREIATAESPAPWRLTEGLWNASFRGRWAPHARSDLRLVLFMEETRIRRNERAHELRFKNR